MILRENQEITITSLQESDLAEVAALEQTVASAWSEVQLAEELRQSSGCRYVARGKSSGRLKAYICCRLVADEAEVLKLVVAPEARRQGVATRLLTFALAELQRQGAVACFLELRASNSAALGLYKKTGFRGIGLRKGYYDHPGEDGVLMRLDLAEQG